MGTKICGCTNDEDQQKLETNILGNGHTEYLNTKYSNQQNTLTYNYNPNTNTYTNATTTNMKHSAFITAIRRSNQANRIIKAFRAYKRRLNAQQVPKFKEIKTSNSTASFNQSMITCHYIGCRNEEGMKEGFGIQTWRDGTKYIGQFRGNIASGWGVFYHIDGDKYSGSFLNDTANGYGIYEHETAKYEGCWKEDCQYDIGHEKWSDSSTYSGDYKKGKKDGIGTYLWQDKAMYQGNWKENIIDGYGCYYFADGRVYIGEWVRNRMHGYGEFSWTEGKKYCGFYKNDKKDGFGVYFWPTSRYYVGFWKEGKQHGIAKYIHGANVKYGIWVNGYKGKCFASEDEFYNDPEVKNSKIKDLFKMNINQIRNFMELDLFTSGR